MAQIEINFNHGDPLQLADQAFLFKRTVRQAALRHDVYATFMAKPMQGEPGSAMHIHQSVLDSAAARNIFADAQTAGTRACSCRTSPACRSYLPAMMPLIAPYVNSYRRFARDSDAPINTHWGRENRTVGLRVPESECAEPARREPRGRRRRQSLPRDRRVARLRLSRHEAEAEAARRDRGQRLPPRRTRLPRTLQDALHRFQGNRQVKDILGENFVEAVVAVKEAELSTYQQVISSWEREHLLLNV